MPICVRFVPQGYQKHTKTHNLLFNTNSPQSVDFIGFTRKLLVLFCAVLRGLLPNTKLSKDIPQQVLRRDIPCNRSEVEHGLTDVHRDEVGSDLHV